MHMPNCVIVRPRTPRYTSRGKHGFLFFVLQEAKILIKDKSHSRLSKKRTPLRSPSCFWLHNQDRQFQWDFGELLWQGGIPFRMKSMPRQQTNTVESPFLPVAKLQQPQSAPREETRDEGKYHSSGLLTGSFRSTPQEME